MPISTGPAVGQPADMGKRFLAAILDIVIIGIPLGILYAILAAAIVTSGSCGVRSDGRYSCVSESGLGVLYFIEIVLGVGLLCLFAYLTGIRSGQTPGMAIIGTKIVDRSNGQLIGFGRALLRQFLYGICIIVALSSFFDSSPLHQGWHDKAANDIVIRTK